MRNKKIFLFDEEVEAKKIYTEGFPNGNINYSQMYLVAKYIRQSNGYGEIRLEREIIDFCKRQDKHFNPIKEAGAIRKWVKSALQYDLRKIDSVDISPLEISALKKISDSKDRRILFTILVFSKALKNGNAKRDKSKIRTSEYYYIHYNNFMDIIRLSKINGLTEIKLADILHNYSKYFIFYSADRELIRLNYAVKNIRNPIKVSNLDNVSDFYNILFENHKIVGYCEECGKEIIKNSNSQKYCETCAREKRMKRQRRYMQEAYKRKILSF